MPNPVLYVLPEDHHNKQDQEKRAALNDLAYYGAINVLLENVYFHDTSGRGGNAYGVEEENSHKKAALILRYTNSVSANVHLAQSDKPKFMSELQTARTEARKEVKTLKQQGSLPKKATRQELKQYIDNWPIQREAELEEKYLFYKRNHKISKNIKITVQSILADANNPRVFALSIGAKHIDSSTLNPSLHYQGKKDLPTTLGNSITAGRQTVDVIYGAQTAQTIAQKALDLSDSLPWGKRLIAQARLKLFLM